MHAPLDQKTLLQSLVRVMGTLPPSFVGPFLRANFKRVMALRGHGEDNSK
jgi:hypothetical protein